MSDLLYQTDAYLRRFDAEVVRTDPQQSRLVLDRTAFFPGGGGQPDDRGRLDQMQVERVTRQGDTVWHWLRGGVMPAVGRRVRGEIDWPRRHLLMRTHTALHVLCGVVWRDLGARVTGGNMEPGSGRLDFELGTLSRELVETIEERCRQELAAAREVRVRILDRAEAVRIPDLIRTKVDLLPAGLDRVRTVEIVGLDLQADGGTHVANTAEIGAIRIVKYKSKGASNKRLYLAVADA